LQWLVVSRIADDTTFVTPEITEAENKETELKYSMIASDSDATLVYAVL
jgi:hypothetical protein